MQQQTIRLSLPSKGRLEGGALDFLSDAGLAFSSNCGVPADVPAARRGSSSSGQDIVVSVRQGSVEFGITGLTSSKAARPRRPGHTTRLVQAVH
jgi:ATP phosphoribosyltransferase